MLTNTSFALKRLNGYVYNLCAQIDSCIWVRICAYSDVLRMCTALPVNWLMCTRYGIARKATYSSRYFLIASTWKWQSMDARFNVAMTVDGVLDCSPIVLILCYGESVRRMRSSVFSLRRSWLLIGPYLSKDAIFRLLSTKILTSNWAVLLVQSWGFRRAYDFSFNCPLDDFYLLNPV